jgi:hypothetical protein
MSVYMMRAFATLYEPSIALPVTWTWLMVFGFVSFRWLSNRTRRPLTQALLVPLPMTLSLFGVDLESTGELRRASQWLLTLPLHALGVLAALYWIKHRTNTRDRRDS